MVKINHIEEPVCELWFRDKNDNCNFIGYITSHLSLLDIRVQIKKEQLYGYYIWFHNPSDTDYVIKIDKNGELETYPDDFYDKYEKLLLQLV